jgi:hypothetical protein
MLCLWVRAALASAQELQEHDGSQGVWLRGKDLEAFVCLQPVFRIAAVRKPGGTSVMADSTGVEKGLRLAFMSPIQIPKSFDVGNQPAEVIERDDHAIKLRLAVADGLRYEVSLTADTKISQLQATYELFNVGKESRQLACWSLIALAGDGTIITPFGSKPRARRRIVLPWWTIWPQPTYRFGRDALAVNIAAPPAGNCKVGVINDAGWIAIRSGSQLLVSTVTFDDKGHYPEDGANITIFQSRPKDRDQTRCEIEQLGPLQQIEPLQSVRMTETLRLLEVTDPPPADAAPDSFRKQVETAMDVKAASKQ